jgi:hypothetical protein
MGPASSQKSGILQGDKMKTVEKGLFGFVMIFFYVFLMTAPVFPQENIVHAKIGIMAYSVDKSWYVKSQEKLTKGDNLRIYVRPEADSYVYVIHTDKKTVSLLIHKRVRESTLVMPSERDFYQIDGESAVEVFTIVCSAKEVKELSSMQNSELPYGQWASLEETLINRSKIELGQTAERPIPIAGGVRGISPDRSIQTFSAKSLIVKKYEFSVKK